MYVNVHTHDEFCYRSGFDNESKQFINHSPAVQKFEEEYVTDLGHMAGVEIR